MGKSFNTWYAANGTKHNERRRERRHSDPAYAAKVKEARRKSDRKAAKARREARRVQFPKHHKAYDEGVCVETGVVEGGVYFTISALAKAMGVEAQTVRLWERAGKIPPASHRTRAGYRLYTLAVIEALADERGALKAAPTAPFKTQQEFLVASRRIRLSTGEEIDSLVDALAKVKEIFG